MNTQILVNTDLLEQAMQATHVQNSQALVETALQLMIQKQRPRKRSEQPIIGLWEDREDMKDVEAYVSQLRKSRYS